MRTAFVRTTDHLSDRRNGLTLQEEARNTKGHWGDSDKKLRNSKVNFVSAGSYNPQLKEALEGLSLVGSHKLENVEICGMLTTRILQTDTALDKKSEELDVEVTVEEEIQIIVEEDEESEVEGVSQDPYFTVDLLGGKPVNTGLTPPRCVSPTPSNSSDEVILFSGRNKQPSKPEPPL